MAQVKEGDTVSVHYTGRLEDGTVFDSSSGRDPLQFTVGGGQVIAGFESAVLGMEVGQTKEQHIPVDEAYGPHRDEMVLDVGREQLPPDMTPEVGQQLQLGLQDGGAVPVTIVEVTDEAVKLDGNHPLAGQPLIFDIELVEIG
ncbi:MAG: peptidylprolyl isomerase [Bacteroidota bacterium]